LKEHSLPAQFLQSSVNINQIKELGISEIEVSNAISKKRKFGELFGLGRKLIVDVIEDGDEETYHEVLDFFQSVQRRRLQRITSNVNGSSSDSIMEIRNPVIRIPKGRPKGKRTKGILEESNTKTQYRCKNCKQLGHNSNV
jgi:hypothetical protein